METVKFDMTKECTPFKLLNATNGGPWHTRHATDQWRSNFSDYKAARIPYSRNHDSNISGSVYGGPYAHDISVIFPDFSADVNDPDSYDFACTDESILTTLEAGTKTFFRLGQSIEHQIKKHGTLPPADFKKWAVICEHIIRHYNEGWADGFRLDMDYWEIWNEPDLDNDDSDNKRTWGGTKAEFFDLYEITAKHLKSLFPNLKIGGPALAYNEEWGEDFLCEMQKRKVPIDFFSWHVYCTEPISIGEKSARIRALLDKYGYEKTESILNEWNYIRGWTDQYIYSINAIHSIKGAAFTMACITKAQHSDIDMLMYYDTRPSVFCGAFDFYTYEKLKGYYPLYWYGMMYDALGEVPSEGTGDNVYALCGKMADGKALAIITYYTDCATDEKKEILADFGHGGKFEIYLVDKTHSGELLEKTDEPKVTLSPCSFALIREV